MRNSIRKARFLIIVLVFAVILSGQSMFAASAQESEVYIGGMPAGFTMGLGGAQIVGMCEILTDNGETVSPAKQAGLMIGDIICKYAGIEICSAEDIDQALAIQNEKSAEISVSRDGERFNTKICPAKDRTSNKYKLGILIRDSVSGIGTVTYIEKTSLRFGSLGHALSDDKGNPMSLSSGSIYPCSIVNVVRGERGKAGELKGLFVGEKGIASAETNCDAGIFGNFSAEYDFSTLRSVKTSDDAQPGKASIYTTVDGISPKEYTVSIIKVDEGNRQNKNFVLKVTDRELLAATGGIVQGMSGSPIIQAGKLIGAVTHVFLNDPTRGYGIAIENMLGN